MDSSRNATQRRGCDPSRHCARLLIGDFCCCQVHEGIIREKTIQEPSKAFPLAPNGLTVMPSPRSKATIEPDLTLVLSAGFTKSYVGGLIPVLRTP